MHQSFTWTPIISAAQFCSDCRQAHDTVLNKYRSATFVPCTLASERHACYLADQFDYTTAAGRKSVLLRRDLCFASYACYLSSTCSSRACTLTFDASVGDDSSIRCTQLWMHLSQPAWDEAVPRHHQHFPCRCHHADLQQYFTYQTDCCSIISYEPSTRSQAEKRKYEWQ